MADDLGFTLALPKPETRPAPPIDPLRPMPRQGLGARLAEIERLRESDRDEDRAVIFCLAIGATFCLLMLALLFLSQPRGEAVEMPDFPDAPQASAAEIWTPAPLIELADLPVEPTSTLGGVVRETAPELSDALMREVPEPEVTAASLAAPAPTRVRPEPVATEPVRPDAPSSKPTPPEALVAARRAESRRASAPISSPSIAPQTAGPGSDTPAAGSAGRSAGVRVIAPRAPSRATGRASAGRAVIDLVSLSGEILPPAAESDLAARVLRTLETAPVNGLEHFRTPEGRNGKLYVTDSRIDTSTRLVRRNAAIAQLPASVRLEAGWFVAREPTALRAVPGHSPGGLAPVSTGVPLERMASLEDPYGVRWYLFGQEGTGIGYLPAHEVMPAELYSGELSAPLQIALGDTVADAVEATTSCRGLYVQIDGVEPKGASFCRGAAGDWQAEGFGEPAVMPVARNAKLWSGDGPVRLEQAAVLAIQADAPEGDNGRGAELARMLRHWLSTAEAGDERRITLRDGTLVTARFGPVRDEMRSMTIARTADVTPLPSGMRFETGWLEALTATRLQAVPAPTQGAELARLEPGLLIEKLAMFESAAGGSWYLVGLEGIGLGFVPMTAMALADAPEANDPRIVGLTIGRVARDQVRAGTLCRDMSLNVARTSRALSGCRAADGEWVLEADMGGWVDVMPMAARTQ
jgi:hypothetical protein